jgi:hypothetical protein
MIPIGPVRALRGIACLVSSHSLAGFLSHLVSCVKLVPCRMSPVFPVEALGIFIRLVHTGISSQHFLFHVPVSRFN